MAKSTRPKKPRPDFPLFPHRTGRWCKKVRGSFVYFGKVADDPKGEKALEKWLKQKDDLLAGRKPRPETDGMTVDDLCNLWLQWKEQRVKSGDLSFRTWDGYKSLVSVIFAAVGRSRDANDLGPDDFQALRDAYAKRWGPAAVGVAVTMTRSIWKWGWNNKKLSAPAQFGSGFDKPSAKTVRQSKLGSGRRMFTPEQVKALLAHASTNMRAMLLLGVQAGVGNTDLGLLRIAAINLESGWLELPRAKTAIMRRIPLWPETIAAVREVLANRPKPKAGNESLLFISPRGVNYVSGRRGTNVWKEFQAAAVAAGVENRTFYDARRTFCTVADGAKDPVAVTHLMGHAPKSGDMSAIYRQFVADERLRAVTDHVHDWLFGTGDTGQDDDEVDVDTDTTDTEAGQDDEPLTIAIHKARKAIAETAGPVQTTLRDVWLPEITRAVQGDVEAARRVLATWGDGPKLRVVSG
ncbi:MAG: integrase [Pirellulaceae bacterium]|nr:integrase [Pirellulaceae bacterium]